jgi:hypothetical protein
VINFRDNTKSGYAKFEVLTAVGEDLTLLGCDSVLRCVTPEVSQNHVTLIFRGQAVHEEVILLALLNTLN